MNYVPIKCPACGGAVSWNSNNIELVCDNDNCKAKRLAQIISFFAILEVENAGEGIMSALYDAGYDTIAKILNMKKTDFEKLDSFGKRKADIVYTAIHDKMKGVTLSKLQHASGLFGSLGSRKLKLVEDFSKKYMKTGSIAITNVMETEGFAQKSTDDFVNGLTQFEEFIKGLPITIKEDAKPLTDKYAGMSFVFTGFRSKEHEATVIENGGKMSESVSKTTTYLIMKEKGSGSSKETKALKAGVKVMDLAEFEAFLENK